MAASCERISAKTLVLLRAWARQLAGGDGMSVARSRIETSHSPCRSENPEFEALRGAF
jgi:hypothetical protein